ncbi:MAG: efflux RND transporter permease subunit [Xenococcaceae cyanobacterium MO_188.B32]|nr:efflux RND transporter permease subunit [Xenococcaceae cyanobacterium MO_188.B32]
MFTLFYRHVRLLILTIILIFVWGISSYLALPRLEDPELVSRFATVKTFFPGAKAEIVEALVTKKIEDELIEIEEIDNYESTSSTGSSIISIELKDSVKKEQVDAIWSRVQNKIDRVKPELPANITEPELEKGKVKAYALITALTWQQNDSPNYAILRRQAEALKDRLKTISGTEEIELFGERDEEILVAINPSLITSYNLTAADIARQIQQSDAKVSAGLLRNSDNDLSIEIAGELDTLERIRNIPISFGSNGQFIRLQDLATVSKGVSFPANELTLISDRPAVTLAVHIESASRLDLWATRADKVLAEFKAGLPKGIGLQTVFAQSNYVEARLNGLIFNLVLGAGLVFVVTLLMMGWRSAIIVGTALPLSVLMVFGWMNVMGIPLHQMSITGLIVALGILIDNAIVMVDEVTNHLERGFKAKDAITNSIDRLAVPLLSSTITTILAFLPIALLPGATGEFVGAIGLSVILAVSSSLFLALTVIPALTAKFYRQNTLGAIRETVAVVKHCGLGEPVRCGGVLRCRNWRGLPHEQMLKGFTDISKLSNPKGESPLHRSLWWKTGVSIPILTELYGKTLKWTIARPVLGIFLALLLPVWGFMQAGSLEQQFFPAADRDQLQIQLELPAATSITQTQTIARQIRARIIKSPEITDVHWFIGRSAPRFYYNVAGSREREANYAQAIVQLNSMASASFTKQLQTELDRTFPIARILVRQLEQGPPFDAPIEMRIYGHDLDVLQQIGEQTRSLLVQLGQITHTRASLDEIRPQLQIQVDEEEILLAGLTRTTIAQQLDSTLEGITGGSILEATEELPVKVRLAKENRTNVNDITSLDLLPTASGRSSDNPNSVPTVPISSLGQVSLETEISKITHYNGQRVNTVQGFLTAGVLPDGVLSEFKQLLDRSNFQLPNGYTYEFGGEAEQKDDAIGGLVSTVGVLAVLTIATLVLSLGSFRLAAVIGIVATASFGLGLFAIWLFNYPFGFNPIIGSVGLIGVAINDSIVVLAAIQQHPVAKIGDRRAIRAVVLHSTRHVIATTLTTAIGFVPLLLGGGEFWPPLAIAIAGGVIGATLLALYLVPSAYRLLQGNYFSWEFGVRSLQLKSDRQ